MTVEGNQLLELLLTRTWSESETESSSQICLHKSRKGAPKFWFPVVELGVILKVKSTKSSPT